MGILALVLLLIGTLALCAGTIILLVESFRVSAVWGLVYLLLPFGNVAFIVVHFSKARAGFLVSIAGVLLCVGAILGTPGLAQSLGQMKTFDAAELEKHLRNPQATPAPDLSAQIEEKRLKIEQMEAQFAQDGPMLVKLFQDLTTRRSKLKPGDAAALTAFNAEAADYQTRNAARKQARLDLDTLHQEVESLLEQRSRRALTTNKRVVMYTTSRCATCKAAKSYFAQKGVGYEEHDVENSPEARAEFEKLGGQGVPLILVGGERMEGFNAQRLNELL